MARLLNAGLAHTWDHTLTHGTDDTGVPCTTVELRRDVFVVRTTWNSLPDAGHRLAGATVRLPHRGWCVTTLAGALGLITQPPIVWRLRLPEAECVLRAFPHGRHYALHRMPLGVPGDSGTTTWHSDRAHAHTELVRIGRDLVADGWEATP
ncbi:hypothetical protein HDA32_005820 [Spinactinospora alkalitolerans]|uniref:Uncharacterized protein n=1 Tax=Spinactinospora alkalitolerans TaxID=687207 RepID=A0A852U9S0_9ACTN|nr:hypothetical protein [Spinactinospora alkalitolerans]NYE50700.1 hypothetical protein [Spinactinospora alkalitolerans]